MKLKKGDQVIITKGKDKGRKGKIEKIFSKTGRVLIPGINIYKRHLKAQGQNKKGGIIDKVMPISLTNVALLCPKCGKKTRVGFQLTKGEKQRLCKKCGALL